jgi:fibronectin-binding autotransporter adhesin
MQTMRSIFNSAALSGIVVFACLTGINSSAQAADQLWIGSAGNHDVITAANWVGGAPVLDQWQPFVFGNDVVDGNMNLSRWIAISSITLNSGCTIPISINWEPIIMGGSLIDMSAAGDDLTINSQLNQGWGDMTFNVGAGRTLTVNGGVGEAHWFTYSGTNGATDYLQTGLTKNGAGTAVLTSELTYTLGTTVNGGTLVIGGAGQLGGGSYSGQIINNAAFVYGSSAAQTLSGAISGTGSIIQNGPGTLTLWGANTYSGTTTVSAGTLQYNSAAAAGNTSKIIVNNGGTLYIDWWAQGGTISAPIELNGFGNGNGALKTYVEGSQFTFTGPVTLLSNSLIQAFAGNSTLYFNEAIGGTGNLTLLANGASPNHRNFIVLSGASTFSGDLFIESYAASAQVTLSGGDNRLPTNAVVHIAAGKWAQDSNDLALMTSSVLDLNGCNQTLAGLSDSGASSLAGARSVVNTSNTTVTLTLNTSSNQLFSGTIGGTNLNGMAGFNLALVKTGIATQTLTGVNTYIGSTAVSNGTLVVQQKCLSETADVHIAAGAKLDLGFEGINTVRTLTIDGVLQVRKKIYSIANRPQALAGTGLLYVTDGSEPPGTVMRFR